MSTTDIKSQVEVMKEKVNNIERILMGNGTKGLLRQMTETNTAIIKLQAEGRVKLWIYRISFPLLLGALGWLLAIQLR